MPLFSVIIPLYNKEAFIGTTLQSLLAQSYNDFEIIIINDGSTDGSEAVVKQYADERIRYYSTVNQKVSAARNTGIKLAEGKIIAFLDADDYWEPGHLKALHELYLQFPEAGLFLSRYKIKIGNETFITPIFNAIDDNFLGIVKDPFRSSLQYRLSQPSATAVRKEVFGLVGYFDVLLSQMEDIDMWIRIVLAYPMAISDKSTVIYNFDIPNSLSRVKIRDRHIFDFEKYKDEESKNPSLKDFIDVYRLEYALKFRIEDDIENSSKLYKSIAPKNIPLKTKLFFLLPPFVLKNLLRLKHWLHKKGITFSVYN